MPKIASKRKIISPITSPVKKYIEEIKPFDIASAIVENTPGPGEADKIIIAIVNAAIISNDTKTSDFLVNLTKRNLKYFDN